MITQGVRPTFSLAVAVSRTARPAPGRELLALGVTVAFFQVTVTVGDDAWAFRPEAVPMIALYT